MSCAWVATDLAQTARERKCDTCTLRDDLGLIAETSGGDAKVGSSNFGVVVPPDRLDKNSLSNAKISVSRQYGRRLGYLVCPGLWFDLRPSWRHQD